MFATCTLRHPDIRTGIRPAHANRRWESRHGLENTFALFRGRVGRGKYWGFVIASIAILGALSGLSSYNSAKNSPDPAAGGGIASVLMRVVGLACLWAALAIKAKRWHDGDTSPAGGILISLVPAVGSLIARVCNGSLAGRRGPNRFGAIRG